MKLPRDLAAKVCELAGVPAAGPSRAQPEAAFQRKVIQYAQAHGWKVVSFRAVRVQRKDGSVFYQTPTGADSAGWPDLLCVKKGRPLTAVELKSRTGRPTAAQLAWLDLLADCDVRAFVWWDKPGVWVEIERVLGGKP